MCLIGSFLEGTIWAREQQTVEEAGWGRWSWPNTGGGLLVLFFYFTEVSGVGSRVQVVFDRLDMVFCLASFLIFLRATTSQ